MNLYDWQKPYADRMHEVLEKQGVVYTVLPTGAGKSYLTADVLRRRGRCGIVFCPKAVIPSWHKVLDAFGLTGLVVPMNYEQLTNPKCKFAKSGELGDWITRGKATLWNWREELAGHFDLVFDESHRTNGRDSRAGELLIGAASQRIPAILLTATPPDNPLKMKALGIGLGLFERGDFWNWAWGHGIRKSPFHQGFEFPLFSKKDREYAAGHLARVHAEIFPSRGVYMTTAELLKFFPGGHIYLERVALPEEAKFFEEHREELAELEAAVEASELRLVEQLRIHQEVEFRKVAVFAELAKDLLEQGLSVPCFVCYRKTAEALAEELKADLVIGEQSAGEREAAIARFQNNESRVLVLTSMAGGEGISLHDLDGAHPRVSLISPIWDPVKLKQVLGRIHRAGGKSVVSQRILVTEIEERIYRQCLRRLRNMGIMAGDSAGFNLEEL
jgi:superfamily II DNA or RNA helicase